MSNKTLFFFDTETSGLDASRHTILQIAWIIEKNGAVMCERVFDIHPGDDADFNLMALAVNNFTIERMMAGKEAALVFGQMKEDVKLAVGGGPALTPVGHNVKFDIDMLHALAKKNNETWWLNFGHNDYLDLKKPLCTVAMCHWLNYTGALSQSDYKLTSCCKNLNIELEGAHDALQDVRATRQLFHRLIELAHRPLADGPCDICAESGVL